MKDYVSVDLETSGFSPTNNEILEIGAVKVRDGVVTDKFSTIIKPLGYVGRSIYELTGITKEDLANGEPCEDVILEFFDFCEDLPFLGYNLGFDYRFLVEKGKPFGVDFSLHKRRKGIDAMALAKKFVTTENYKQSTVAVELGIPLGSIRLHRALDDALVCKMIYERFQILHSDVYGVERADYLDKDAMKYGGIVDDKELDFK